MTPSGPFSLGGRARRKGVCPVCSRRVALNRDGMVAGTPHDDPVTRRRCLGMGEAALPLPKGEG